VGLLSWATRARATFAIMKTPDAEDAGAFNYGFFLPRFGFRPAKICEMLSRVIFGMGLTRIPHPDQRFAPVRVQLPRVQSSVPAP